MYTQTYNNIYKNVCRLQSNKQKDRSTKKANMTILYHQLKTFDYNGIIATSKPRTSLNDDVGKTSNIYCLHNKSLNRRNKQESI